MEIIIGRQGNQKKPITDTTVSRRHCKVTDNGNGTYTIENLSPSGTKVDGVDVIRTTARADSLIQLGQTFTAKLGDLIGAAPTTQKAAPKPPVPPAPPKPQEPEVKTFSISHLRHVWDDFNNTNLAMAESQRKTNLVRAGFGIFTMCAMPTIYFIGQEVGFCLTGLGVMGNIYSFAGMKNSETAEERQRRQDAFDDAWVCPNPECGHSLPAKNYRLLVRNHQSCPYCKCKYVER